jgi:hypothetical protein
VGLRTDYVLEGVEGFERRGPRRDAGGLEEVVVHEAALLHPRVDDICTRGPHESEDACSKMWAMGEHGSQLTVQKAGD